MRPKTLSILTLLLFASGGALGCGSDTTDAGAGNGGGFVDGNGARASGGGSGNRGGSDSGGNAGDPTSGGAKGGGGGWGEGAQPNGSGGSDGSAVGGTGGAGATGGNGEGLGGTSSGGSSGGAGEGSGGKGCGGEGCAEGIPVEHPAPALLAPRQEHAVTAFQGEVYTLGGFNPENTASMEVYDPETEQWRPAQDFPVGCHHPNLVPVGDLLYVAGFHLGGENPLRMGDPRTFAYDPMSDSWSPRADMPEGTGRGASCVAALGTSIYVFGGSDDPTLATSSVYDTVTDTWAPLPDLPRPRDHCFASAIDGKIYILAGRNGGITDIEPESWVFDPVVEEYEEIAPIPTPRAGVAGGIIHGKIYIFGGEGNPADPAGMFSEIEVYDPATNSWESLPPMSEPRHGFGGASIEGRIYLPGGGTAQGLQVVPTHSVFFLEP